MTDREHDMNTLSEQLKVFFHDADAVDNTILHYADQAALVRDFSGKQRNVNDEVWNMYIQICKVLDIHIDDTALKEFANVAISNIRPSLIGAYWLDSIMAPLTCDAYYSRFVWLITYLAGQMFKAILLAFAKAWEHGTNLNDISPVDIRSILNRYAPSNVDVKNAKKAFRRSVRKHATR